MSAPLRGHDILRRMSEPIQPSNATPELRHLVIDHAHAERCKREFAEWQKQRHREILAQRKRWREAKRTGKPGEKAILAQRQNG